MRGLSILPAAAFMVLVAPRSAKLIESHGTRVSRAVRPGVRAARLPRHADLLEGGRIAYWKVGIGYALVGIGVGLAGPPTSNALTGSVPVRRVGMASGTADLQRDLGGAVMQSIFGALADGRLRDRRGDCDQRLGKNVTTSIENELTKSFSSAADVAKQYPAARRTDHRRRARPHSCTATNGPTLQASSPS